MADFGVLSDRYDSAVEELISQANDHYVLEQVSAINLSSFSNSSLPTNLETRLRSLKSLPDSKPDPVKDLPRSMTIASHGNASCSASPFSARENVDFEDSIVKSGFEKSPRASFWSDSGKIDSKQTLELPKEKFRMSSSSFTSIDLASPTSSPDSQEKRSNPKLKLKTSSSWFNKLAPSRAIGCLWSSPSKSSSSSNKTKKTKKDIDFNEFLSHLGNLSVEEQRKMLKNAIIESQQMPIKPAKFIKTTN